jgi:ATP-dependent DNA helicase RecG
VCEGEKSRKELQQLLELKHEDHFRNAYLVPALEQGLVEMCRPETPKSRLQRYRLTAKGIQYREVVKRVVSDIITERAARAGVR